MAPPSLPSIPDIALDLDEKAQLIVPELDEMLSATAESSTTLDEEDDFRPSRSHSTHTQHSARQRRVLLPTRLPSVSHTYTTLPLSPRRPDPAGGQTQSLQLPPSQKTVFESWTITYHHPAPRHTATVQVLGLTVWRQAELEQGSVQSVVPNTHFTQDELAATVAMHEAAAAAAHARARQRRRCGITTAWLGADADADAGVGVGADGLSPKAAVSGSLGGGVAATGAASLLYAADLEARLRRLDWKVQDEIHELLSDRVQSSSSAFRRREWRVVVLTQVPGGELTDAPTGFGPASADITAAGAAAEAGAGAGAGAGAAAGRWSRWWRGRSWWCGCCCCFGGLRRPRRRPHKLRWVWTRRGERETPAKDAPSMPVTEYRLILRGTETRANDQGWGYYNRYSRPWRTADEKEIGERRRWSTVTGRSDKYVDF